MAQPYITSVIPNIGLQGEAIAGNQGATFTAADRKVIQELAGEIDKTKSFKEVFFKRDVTHKVENEQTNVKPKADANTLENRIKEHQKMLKHSVIITHKDNIDIAGHNEILDDVEVPSEPDEVIDEGVDKVGRLPFKDKEKDKAEIAKKEDKTIDHKTAAIAQELNMNPAELFDKFSLEQAELFSLMSKVKELHLKRLLCVSKEEFDRCSEEIAKETLASSRPEAREWLSKQLNLLTRTSAEYKINLFKSLHSMHYDGDEKEGNISWLQKAVKKTA